MLVENSYPKDQIDQHFANQITGDEIQDYFSSENSTKITSFLEQIADLINGRDLLHTKSLPSQKLEKRRKKEIP